MAATMQTLEAKLEKIKSPSLQSQQKTAVVLQAVEATLKEQNTGQTPTGYFAALLSLLNQSSNSGTKGDLISPIVYLLDVVTPFAPEALLRAKFTQILSLLAPILQSTDAEPILLRSSIGCLESLLLAQDSSAWELSVAQISPRKAVAGLLGLAMDQRPKVRKRAQEAVKKILRNPPPSPSLDHPAADMCAQTVMKVLEALGSSVTAGKKQKNNGGAHDPGLIHALQMVKAVASASGGWPSQKIEPLCELLLGIARTGNEYMTVATFDIFEIIFEGLADEVASAKLPRLMEIITDLRPTANDTQLVPPWLAVLSRGYDVSAQIEPEETFLKLPELFELVMAFLESPSPNVRISASECLVSFMANCIPKQVVLDASIYDEKILGKLSKSAASLLSVQYQAAWLETFKVLGAMFDSLRWRSYPVMVNIVKIIGEIRESESFRNKKEADEVLGKAIRAMGPEAVLAVLPLNLIKAERNQPGRAWLLPALRDFTSNTNLAHFRSEMIPISEVFFQKVLDHGEAEKTTEIKIYETVVQQVWSILPGYCDLPLDLTDAFDQSFAEMLANLLYSQVGLRQDVCRGLRVLVESNRAIASVEEEEDLAVQSRISKEAAAKNLAHLGQFGGNMLAVLFNVYTLTLPHSRGPILQTINAYLSISPTASLLETFNRVSQLLAEELKKNPEPAKKEANSDNHMPPTSNTLMDIIITMSIYLPRESYSALFEMAAQVIFREEEPQLQKKAYKLIPRLAESETGQQALKERHDELLELLRTGSQKVSAPARRERLAALMAFLPFLPDTSLHFIPSILSEVVICCKENNERARESAYDLLVQMGHRMEAAQGAIIDNSKVPHMPQGAPNAQANIEEYFTMVSAGLAGTTPHMISATVTALTRLLYEFRASLNAQTMIDMVQTMDLFLTSNNREIVKSVLGFVKVSVISLPVELMTGRLSTLVPNLIVWSHEHKGRFKSKVKHILERMIRRFGYDNVHNYCPEDDRKLLVNIRKSKLTNKKKKKGAADDYDDSGSEEERGKPSRKFESEFDEALYSSDSDASDEEAAPTHKKGARKGGDAYIMEDDDEPLDLLDRKSLANISSTKPVRIRKPTKSRAKTDSDGKLILGKDGDDADAMEIDQPAAEESGVGAYVAALKGKDVAKRGRGGKLKFSNRRSKDGEDEMDEDDAVAVKQRLKARGGASSPGRGRGNAARGGRGGRGGKGNFGSDRRGPGGFKRRGHVLARGVGKKQDRSSRGRR